MRKIVPFKKDIIFKTNLAEITSISLEHNLHIEGNDLITGEFIISGEYKMADNSINTEPFSFNLPFDIALDSDKNKIDNVVIDIDNFYYEIINNNILSVNIDVLIDKLEEKPLIDNEELKESTIEIHNINIDDNNDNERKEEFVSMEEIKDNEQPIEAREEDSRNWFDSFDSSRETYTTYKVYIVKEGDNLEVILQKYEIEKEDLEKYNDLNEIKIGDKIIIPATRNAQN